MRVVAEPRCQGPGRVTLSIERGDPLVQYMFEVPLPIICADSDRNEQARSTQHEVSYPDAYCLDEEHQAPVGSGRD